MGCCRKKLIGTMVHALEKLARSLERDLIAAWGRVAALEASLRLQWCPSCEKRLEVPPDYTCPVCAKDRALLEKRNGS